jgi:transcription elongation factor GreA
MTDVLMTQREHDKLSAELSDLEGHGRRAIAERIKVAREWGDLKENAEYHDAKNSQAMLETRIIRLRERLRAAVIVDENTNDGSAHFGSTITIRDDQTGRDITYTLVGSSEADAAAGKLSAESPVGKALLGRNVGDCAQVATPRGERIFTVIAVA